MSDTPFPVSLVTSLVDLFAPVTRHLSSFGLISIKKFHYTLESAPALGQIFLSWRDRGGAKISLAGVSLVKKSKIA